MAPPSADTQHPYLNGVTPEYPAAAAVLNDRYRKLTTSVRHWQLMAGGLLLSSVAFAGGLVYVTSRQQIVPYLVEVDDTGSAAVVKELRASSVVEPRVVQALLTHWLKDIRTIPADGLAMQRQMNAAFGMCLQEAQRYIDDYYRRLAPLTETQKQGRVFPEQITVIPVTATTWRVRWKEQHLGPDGAEKTVTDWEATLELAWILPRSHDEQQRSPLGVWIARVQWAQL
jgi:type IV secretory pathway TrbF-like protein